MATQHAAAVAFRPGRTVATPGALSTFSDHEMGLALGRHLSGDWGDIDPEDRGVNEQALIAGERLLSSYNIRDERLWIITEWDRSVTTLLLPEEY